MTDLKTAVPLTFALALSSSLPGAGVAATGDASELLKPGALRRIIGAAEPLTGDKVGADNPGAKTQMAQCWYGYWRRC